MKVKGEWRGGREAARTEIDMIGPEKIKQICDSVWRDRAAILTARDILGGEDALVGAVY